MKNFFLNERIIISIILLNSILIFLEGFTQFNNYELIFNNFHYLFLIIYILELLFKIREFGFKNYIKEGLNKLDFLLVIISFPELFALISNLEITDLSFSMDSGAFFHPAERTEHLNELGRLQLVKELEKIYMS